MSVLDYTNKDYASLRAALLQLASSLLPEWTDQSPNDLGVVLLELFSYMGDSLFYNQDRIAGESFLETAVERRSVVQLLRLIGYELTPPLAASADLTLLFSSMATGSVTISQLTAFKTTASATVTPVGFQYIQSTPITIDLGALPTGYINAKGQITLSPPSPLPSGTTLYRVYQTLPVVQIDANVTNEIVASSDGSPSQRYALARSPVVDATLVVSVNQVAWTRVDSFLDKSSNDQVYTVRRDENEVVWIQFGDDTLGAIPRVGMNNITATYSVGGGVKGNVSAGAISKPVTAVNQLQRVINLSAATGGADAESTADAVVRGPALFRAGGRAVTAADYEVLATTFGVGKAIAQATTWNNINLVVAPEGGGYASETLKQDLLTYLDDKRIMTSIIQIADPIYVPVLLDVTLTVLPQFSQTVVQQEVVNAVTALFAFDNVAFGQTVYISKVYEAIQDVDGVLGLTISTFARLDDPNHPTQGTLPTNGQLVFSAPLGELPIWNGFVVVPSLPLPLPDGSSHLAITGGVQNG